MPSDDLVLNVRQLAGYPPFGSAPPSASLLMQLGIGGAYVSISPPALVATALAQGGDMAIGGKLGVQAISGGSAQFSNAAFNVMIAQKACITDLAADWATLGGVQIATLNDLSNVDAAIRAASVWSFNGRRGDVRLWIDDIRCAGGAPIFSPRFEGSPRACTPPPESNSTRLATTAYVQTALAVEFAAFAPLDSPNFIGLPTAPTAAQGSADGQLATTAFVANAVASATAGVASFNGRTGIVALVSGDITAAGGALLASPVFTGTPSAPTQPTTDNSTRLATTAFVQAFSAPLASPAFTGIPTGPTAPDGTSTNQLATTAFVQTALAASLAGVVTTFNGRAGAVNLIPNDVSAAGGALLSSPAFTGTPTAPTPPPSTSNTQLATCAFVMAALATGGGVLTFNGRAGAVVLTTADVSAVGGALLASPAFTGSPTAATAAPGTNTTQLSTCAFVQAAVSAATAGVASFNGRTGAVTLIATDVTAVLPASTTLPAMNGAASPGAIAAWSRGDHVHPVDTSRYAASNPSNFQTAAQVTASLANYLPITGGTLTGGTGLTISGGNLAIGGGGTATANEFFAAGPTGVVVQSYVPVDTTGYMSVLGTANPLIGPTAASLVVLNYPQLGWAGFRINPTGGSFDFRTDGQAYKAGGGAWGDGSDARIKTIVADYDHGLEEVVSLRPVVYIFRGNDTDGPAPSAQSVHAAVAGSRKQFVGLSAQEAEAALPELVTRQKGYIDGELVDDLRSLDPSALVYALVNAVKTLAARVTALEAA
jgi:endosialidase-like protein